MLTIGLEESLPKLPGAVLPSKLWSPYRLPLIRFLNQYPTERFGRECNVIALGELCITAAVVLNKHA